MDWETETDFLLQTMSLDIKGVVNSPWRCWRPEVMVKTNSVIQIRKTPEVLNIGWSLTNDPK